MCVGKDVCCSVKSRAIKKVVKPMLPRKVTSTARINLNRYWKVLEELYAYTDNQQERCHNVHGIQIPHQEEEESLVKDNRLNEALEQKRQMLRDPPSPSLNLPTSPKNHQHHPQDSAFCICLLSSNHDQEEEEETLSAEDNSHSQSPSPSPSPSPLERAPCAFWNVFGHADPGHQLQPPDALLAVAHKMVQHSS